MEIILIVVAGSAALAVLGFGVFQLRSERQKSIDERLGRYTQDYNKLLLEMEAAEEEERKRKKDEPSALTKALDKAIENRDFAANWREQLARADLQITPGEYAAAHVIAVLAAFSISFFILFAFNIIASIIVSGIAFFVPRIYVSMRKGKRFRQFESQLPDTIGMWVNGLRAGYSVMQAIEAISREAPEPTSKEFKRVVLEMQLGIPRPEAFDHMLKRMPSDDLDLIITAVNVQAEVGGNLAEILDVIGFTIRERIKIKGEIRVMTAQGRITGYIIGGLPIALSILLLIISPRYMSRLFEDRLCGWPLIACGLMLIGLGFAAIQKIVSIEV